MRLGRGSEQVQALRQITLLRDLDRADLEQIAAVTYQVTREPGEYILRQDDVGTELYLVLEGAARVERDGKVLGEIGPRRVIGEMALIDGHRRSASVIAIDKCDLLVIPYDQFWAFLNRTPALQRQLLVALSRRVRELEAQVAE